MTGQSRSWMLRVAWGGAILAIIALLPREEREGYQSVHIPPREEGAESDIAIEARDLTMRFGDLVAVDHVSFRIGQGEIFGFLGSNGCGKTSTMKMLTGLLPPSEGQAWLFGRPVDPKDLDEPTSGVDPVARAWDHRAPAGHAGHPLRDHDE